MRPIDEEHLMEKVSRMIDYCEKNKDKKFNALSVLFQVGDAIMDCPTADVVPRAEIAKIFEEIEELLKDTKDDYRLNDEIREACAVRYAMTKVSDLKKKYTEGAD